MKISCRCNSDFMPMKFETDADGPGVFPPAPRNIPPEGLFFSEEKIQ